MSPQSDERSKGEPLPNEFLVFGKPVIEEPEIAEVVDCLRSGWIGTGPKVHRFERMLEDYVGVPHVRCVSSCTAALTLALTVVGVGPGDEVIVPAMTFVASANAVVHVGATPVLVDSEPGTGLIDLDAVEAAITPRTKALMPVHLAGRPVDMDRLNAIRDRHRLVVVEDAAHALGAMWRDTPIGAHGNLSAYSFYVTKNITTGEGGALATPSEDTAAAVERLALHGLSLGAWQRFSDVGFKHYDVEQPGFKFNMMDLQAALGIWQLPRLDDWIDSRAQLWQRYDELLEDVPVVTPPPTGEGMHHARHLYQVLVAEDARCSRDELLDRLTEAGIGVGVHYRGVHLHPYYRDRFQIDPASLPVASDFSRRTLSLPLSPALTESDQMRVADGLAQALGRSRRVRAPSLTTSG
jgi:dTDP-4-amino-4,6-dideoxygalactose transaminase